MELPETKTPAEQMGLVLSSKIVRPIDTADTEKMQRTGFPHRDLRAYKSLVCRTVNRVLFRGMSIVVGLGSGVNLVIGLD